MLQNSAMGGSIRQRQAGTGRDVVSRTKAMSSTALSDQKGKLLSEQGTLSVVLGLSKVERKTTSSENELLSQSRHL